jgi:hypothetical protein
MKRILVLVIALCLICPFSQAGGKKKSATVQEMQLPIDFGVDLQLAISSRPRMMNGSTEIIGTSANLIGNSVFDTLVKTGFTQPYPWKLTLVNTNVVNAGSTAGGQVYVYGGLINLLSSSQGLWAATLSHEVAHTGLRHQVKIFVQQLYNQRMIEYYQARAHAGDNSANWALIGFSVAAPLALKKIERDQEHSADQTGMLLMARAGYHPDFVFALHHLLRLHTKDQSKFAAFFSDHPRWETRDQRSERVYADALAEFNRLWPNPNSSPGGVPPPVAFLGNVTSAENKAERTADISIPLFCRNEPEPVSVVVVFLKDKAVIKTGALEGDVLHFNEKVQCPDNESSIPLLVHIPAQTIAGHDHKLDAQLIIVSPEGTTLEESKQFQVKFPKK